jgi:Domain of unknown function (DUF1841)
VGEVEQRRQWTITKRRGRVLDVDLQDLDPADEEDRYYFILAEHPELVPAIRDNLDEIELHGQKMNPRLHLTMHQIVANQLWTNDPPEVWETVKRLIGEGYKRHDIVHMIGSVASKDVWTALMDYRPADPADYVAGLEALPDSWENMSE